MSVSVYLLYFYASEVKWASAHTNTIITFSRSLNFYHPQTPFHSICLLNTLCIQWATNSQVLCNHKQRVVEAHTQRKRMRAQETRHCGSGNKALLVRSKQYNLASPKLSQQMTISSRILLRAGQKESRLCTFLNRIPSYKKSAKNYLDKKNRIVTRSPSLPLCLESNSFHWKCCFFPTSTLTEHS